MSRPRGKRISFMNALSVSIAVAVAMEALGPIETWGVRALISCVAMLFVTSVAEKHVVPRLSTLPRRGGPAAVFVVDCAGRVESFALILRIDAAGGIGIHGPFTPGQAAAIESEAATTGIPGDVSSAASHFLRRTMSLALGCLLLGSLVRAGRGLDVSGWIAGGAGGAAAAGLALRGKLRDPRLERRWALARRRHGAGAGVDLA